MTESLEGRTLLSIGLDPTFGSGGISLPNVPQSTATTSVYESVNSIASQNGKIIDVGTLSTYNSSSGGSNTNNLLVSRLNTDGSIDTSFGSNGSEVIPIALGGVTYSVNSAADVVVQADGKIDVLGTASSSSSTVVNEFVVARLNVNGSIDTSFGTGGFRLIAFSSSGPSPTPLYSSANGLAIGPDGKIVAVGSVSTNGTGGQDFAIARLNTDGSLDTSFNTTGEATVAFDLGTSTGSNDDVANAVVVQPDNKIVVVGSADLPSTGSGSNTIQPTDVAVARLNVNGTLDTTFNSTGKLTYTYALGGSSADSGAAVVLQGTQIVIAGTSTELFTSNSGNLNFQEITATRLNANGSFDTSFNGTGKFMLALNTGGIAFGSSAAALSSSPDGSLLIGGTAAEQNSSGNGNLGLLVRLTPTGSLDTTYGSGGTALLPLYFNGRMLVQPDGKVLFATNSGVARTTSPTLAVASSNTTTVGIGKRAGATGVTITFNTAINPVLAGNVKIYQVRNGKSRKSIKIKRMSYDPGTFTLTLNFAKTKVGAGFQVLVMSSGIVAADGQVLYNGAVVPIIIALPH